MTEILSTFGASVGVARCVGDRFRGRGGAVTCGVWWKWLPLHINLRKAMKSDIEIARSVAMDRIEKVAERAGIDAECLDHYGKYIAKLPLSIVDEAKVKKSRLILVTAITATKAGIGKTTVSVGLALGLNRIGKRVSVALREPSLGPCFGVKGGAAGGGYAQVVPMEKINLHFTGDFHAITSAHNMISALLDNYLYQHEAEGFGLKTVVWRRVLDVNDRAATYCWVSPTTTSRSRSRIWALRVPSRCF